MERPALKHSCDLKCPQYAVQHWRSHLYARGYCVVHVHRMRPHRLRAILPAQLVTMASDRRRAVAVQTVRGSREHRCAPDELPRPSTGHGRSPLTCGVSSCVCPASSPCRDACRYRRPKRRRSIPGARENRQAVARERANISEGQG